MSSWKLFSKSRNLHIKIFLLNDLPLYFSFPSWLIKHFAWFFVVANSFLPYKNLYPTRPTTPFLQNFWVWYVDSCFFLAMIPPWELVSWTLVFLNNVNTPSTITLFTWKGSKDTSFCSLIFTSDYAKFVAFFYKHIRFPWFFLRP